MQQLIRPMVWPICRGSAVRPADFAHTSFALLGNKSPRSCPRFFSTKPSNDHKRGTKAPRIHLQELMVKLKRPDLRENIYTIPNALSFARLTSSPYLGYLIVTEQHVCAALLFGASAATDLVDGYVARKFDMKSVLGTVLDPMADKALMTVLTLSLSYVGTIPAPLAVLIIGRDLGLVLASFVVRYRSLPPPKTFARFWDFGLPSVEVHPTLVSKLNTALQLGLMGASLIAPAVSSFFPAFTLGFNLIQPGLVWCVAATTIGSGLSYVFSSNVVRYLHPANKLNRKKFKRH